MTQLGHVPGTWKLPATKFAPQVDKLSLIQWLREDVRNLLLGVDGLDDNGAVVNKLAEVMVLEGNVLGPGRELGALCNPDAAAVVLPCGANDLGLAGADWKQMANLTDKVEKWENAAHCDGHGDVLRLGGAQGDF